MPLPISLCGIAKEQIIDAVRGRKNCLITSSSRTIDFIRQIKNAYGDYVTVIGTYIDNATLNTLFRSLPSITDDELILRMDTGNQIKTSLIRDRNLFDHIVIYGGEDSEFNLNALKVQYDYIFDIASRKEKELNDRMYVEMPYTGKEPYIFVSYSHLDVNSVFPILHKLQLAGFRIWYDEGINAGENWRKILSSKIEDTNSKVFLLFSSENSTKSKHVLAEINLALDLDKRIIMIRIDNSKFGSDIEMYLSAYHYLTVSDNDNFSNKIIASLDSSTRI